MTLNVVGQSNLNDVSVNNLNVSGLTKISSISIGKTSNPTQTLDVSGTLSVSGLATFSEISSNNFSVSGITTISGELRANGGITCDNDKFVVADSTGNTTIAGTLGVSGLATFSEISSNNFYVAGITTISGELRANGGIKCDNDKFVVDSAGNTSIGGTLGVSGLATFSEISSNNFSVISGITTISGELRANGGITCDNDKFVVADSTGNTSIGGTLSVTSNTTIGNTLGINTSSTRTRLSISPTVTEPKITLWDGGSTTLHYGFGVSSNQLNYHSGADHVFYRNGKNGNGTQLLRINSSGNTTIAGTLGINGLSTFSSNMTITNNTEPTITIRTSSGGNGRVSLGNNAHGIQRVGGNNVEVFTAGNGNTILRTGGGEGLRVQSDGRVNISKRSFQGSQLTGNENAFDFDSAALNLNDAAGFRAKVDANNIINFYNTSGVNRGAIKGINSGSVQYATTSDRRKKEDIVDLENGLEKVMKLKPRTYRWKEGSELDDGFIAQEVFETLPNLIPFNRFKCDISQNDVYRGKLCSCCNIEKKSDGQDYIFGIDYGKFTPYLCKAIQEQQQQIETLKNRYDELFIRIQALEL